VALVLLALAELEEQDITAQETKFLTRRHTRMCWATLLKFSSCESTSKWRSNDLRRFHFPKTGIRFEMLPVDLLDSLEGCR